MKALLVVLSILISSTVFAADEGVKRKLASDNRVAEVEYKYMDSDQASFQQLSAPGNDNCLITVSWLSCEAKANTIADRKEKKKYLEDCERFTLDESTGASNVNVRGVCEQAEIKGEFVLRNYPQVIPHMQRRIQLLMKGAGFTMKECQFSFQRSRGDFASCRFSK